MNNKKIIYKNINKLLLVMLLIFTVGCAGTLPEPGMSNTSDDKVIVNEKHLPTPKTAAQERKGNMSPAVMTLIGIGAAAQLGAVLSMNIGDEASNDPIMPLIFFGSGLVLWGAAGITYLIEEHNEPEEKDNKSP